MKGKYFEIDFVYESHYSSRENPASFRTLVPLDAILNVKREDNEDTPGLVQLLVDEGFLNEIGLMPRFYSRSKNGKMPMYNKYPRWVPIKNKYEVIAGKLMGDKAAEILFDSPVAENEGE